MPQMFPLSWVVLFFVIITFYLLLAVKLFFCSIPSHYSTQSKQVSHSPADKWMW